MRLEFVCVTNNLAFYEKHGESLRVEYLDVSLTELFIHVRDKVHIGYVLLTHPLSGSVKPNETPFKTIMLELPKGGGKTHMDSLLLIENSILTCQKFVFQQIKHEKYKQDFEAVDLHLAESALQSILSF